MKVDRHPGVQADAFHRSAIARDFGTRTVKDLSEVRTADRLALADQPEHVRQGYVVGRHR
jgi:hypothetical protein